MEIDRVNETIDAFFDAFGSFAKAGGRFDNLAEVFRANLHLAERHYGRRKKEDRDQEIVDRILAVEATIQGLLDLKRPSGQRGPEAWKKLAREIMECRRATYTLVDPEQPCYTITPAEALDNDDDPYSFAIFDTFAESVGKLLPPLYQLAVEGSWDEQDVGNDDSSAEDPIEIVDIL